ncbi:hypothetical protein D3C81_1831340 [compost metagenome]
MFELCIEHWRQWPIIGRQAVVDPANHTHPKTARHSVQRHGRLELDCLTQSAPQVLLAIALEQAAVHSHHQFFRAIGMDDSKWRMSIEYRTGA